MKNILTTVMEPKVAETLAEDIRNRDLLWLRRIISRYDENALPQLWDEVRTHFDPNNRRLIKAAMICNVVQIARALKATIERGESIHPGDRLELKDMLAYLMTLLADDVAHVTRLTASLRSATKKAAETKKTKAQATRADIRKAASRHRASNPDLDYQSMCRLLARDTKLFPLSPKRPKVPSLHRTIVRHYSRADHESFMAEKNPFEVPSPKKSKTHP